MDDFRNGKDVHMTMTMWVLSFWTGINDPNSLLDSIDFHFVSQEVGKLNNAPDCVFIDSTVANI